MYRTLLVVVMLVFYMSTSFGMEKNRDVTEDANKQNSTDTRDFRTLRGRFENPAARPNEQARRSSVSEESKTMLGDIEILLKLIRTVRELKEAKAYYLGIGYEKDYERAFQLFETVAQQDGDKEAQADAWYYLGRMCYRGLSKNTNKKQAALYFKKAAEQEVKKDSQAAAWYHLGRMAYHDNKFHRDSAKAFDYMSKAARQQENEEIRFSALCYEAVMHLKGEGTKQDLMKGLERLKDVIQTGKVEVLDTLFTFLYGPIHPDDAILGEALHGLFCPGVNTVDYFPLITFLFKKGVNKNFLNKDKLTILHEAAITGSLATVTWLVENGVQLDVPGRNGSTAVYTALDTGKIDIVIYLVTAGAAIEAVLGVRLALAMLAFEKGEDALTRFLIERGCDLECKNKDKKKMILLAYEKNDKEFVKYLIEKGASLEDVDKNGLSMLQIVYEKNDHEFVDYVLEKGAQINTCNTQGITLAHQALEKGQGSIFKELVERAFKTENREEFKRITEARNKEDLTLGGKIIEMGNWELLHFLVEKGINVEARNRKALTLTHQAFEKSVEEAKYLVRNGARVDSTDEFGEPLLFKLVAVGEEDFVLEYLQGAPLNIRQFCLNELKGRELSLLVHVAVKHCRRALTRYLIDNNVDVNVKKLDDITPLHIAAEVGDLEIVQMLVEAGAALDAFSRLYPSGEHVPLYSCCKGGHLAVARFLLERGARKHSSLVTQSVRDENVPLLTLLIEHEAPIDTFAVPQAVEKKNMPMVTLLVEHGASVVEVGLGYCPTVEMAQYLIDHGANLEKMIDIGSPFGMVTPLQHAVLQENSDLFECLIDNGADVNVKDSNGCTILHFIGKYLLTTKDRDIPRLTIYLLVRPIVEKSNIINEKDNMGMTAFYQAILDQDIIFARCLMEKGADINMPDISRRTPFHRALESKNYATIKLLWEAGATLGEQTMSALEIARALSCDNQILSMLQARQ